MISKMSVPHLWHLTAAKLSTTYDACMHRGLDNFRILNFPLEHLELAGETVFHFPMEKVFVLEQFLSEVSNERFHLGRVFD